MEAAWRQHLDPQPVERIMVPAAGAGREGRLPFSGWGARRVGASFAAAALAGLMLGSSVFAGSRAGGPLYESRLALESLALPGDPVARVAAQLANADARLGEAVEAAFRHDDHATAAALGAYDRMIGDLATAEGSSGAAALEAVQGHRDVLLQLAAQVPDDASTGISTALDNSSRVIDRLAGAGQGGNGAGNGAGGPNGAGGTNGEPQGGGSGAGGTSGEPQGGGSGAGGGNGQPQGGGSDANNGEGPDSNTGGQGGNNGGQGGNGQKPVATPAPTPDATPAPAKTPKPRRTPPGDVAPSEVPIPTPDHP
jgi:hypothetical protein